LALLESGQMYLESIYVLSKSRQNIHSLDVAAYMHFSPPSVCRAMGILKKGGYIIMTKDGSIFLTDSGRELAEKIYERHTLLTRFLTGLGVSEATAAEDACKIEHDISDESFEAIKAYIG